MDRIIKITSGIFFIILICFTGVVSYNAFVENAYRSSLMSTYTYNCTISTNTMLHNVTFFIPLPSDVSRNSPLDRQFSARAISGLPDNWNVTLYDTGKSAMVKITTAELAPGSGEKIPPVYTINLFANVTSRELIDTLSPVGNDAIFRPVQDLQQVNCPSESGVVAIPRYCNRYLTTVYADYQASPGATVSIRSSLTGRNDWKIFAPEYNEYKTNISVVIRGENHGWTTADCWLESGIGYYNAPAIGK